LLRPGSRLRKKNLLGRGLTKVEKHLPRPPRRLDFCGAQFIGWTTSWGPLLCSFPVSVKENAGIVRSSRP
jgi:hypothetical protein